MQLMAAMTNPQPAAFRLQVGQFRRATARAVMAGRHISDSIQPLYRGDRPWVSCSTHGRQNIAVRVLAPGSPFAASTCSGQLQPLPTQRRRCACHAVPWEACSALVCCGTVGMLAERTPAGKALSGPVSAMLTAAVLSNLGMLPSGTGSAVPLLQAFTVKLATPLLLYSADLRRVVAGAKALLPAFALGAVGTVMGTLVADLFLHEQLLALGSAVADGQGGLNLAGALAAKNIGGGLNYVAVATALDVPRALFTAGIAIDNIAALVYFPLVSMLGSRQSVVGDRVPHSELPLRHANPTPKCDEEVAAYAQSGKEKSTVATGNGESESHLGGRIRTEDAARDSAPGNPEKTAVNAENVMLTLALAFVIVAMSERFGSASLPVATATTVALATSVPSVMRQLTSSADLLGKVLLFIFFASAGAAADSIRSSLGYGVLFTFLGILYATHLAVILGVGRLLLKLDGAAILVASNANVGGPATAASLASAKQWTDLVVPGVLAGNLGNAIATFLGLGLAGWLGRG